MSFSTFALHFLGGRLNAASTVPIESSIPYSNHRVRVWLRGVDEIYQRLFKSDEFRIGSQLAFEPLLHGSGNVVFATKDSSTPAITSRTTSLHTESSQEVASPGSERSTQTRGLDAAALSDRAREQQQSEAAYQEQRMGINVGIGNPRGYSSVPSILPFDEHLPSYQAAVDPESRR